MARHLPLRMSLIAREGDHRVDICRGTKCVWLNTFATSGEAKVFAQQIAQMTGAIMPEPNPISDHVMEMFSKEGP